MLWENGYELLVPNSLAHKMGSINVPGIPWTSGHFAPTAKKIKKKIIFQPKRTASATALQWETTRCFRKMASGFELRATQRWNPVAEAVAQSQPQVPGSGEQTV